MGFRVEASGCEVFVKELEGRHAAAPTRGPKKAESQAVSSLILGRASSRGLKASTPNPKP